MNVCDDEAKLVVASVGAEPYHPCSHGFCQMELLVAVSEPQHSQIWSVKSCLPTRPYGLLKFMLMILFNSPADLLCSLLHACFESLCLEMITGALITDEFEFGFLKNTFS